MDCFFIGAPCRVQNCKYLGTYTDSSLSWKEHIDYVYKQVALLWQRDRATRLSVEILQLQNIPIVWNYLRDPTFSRFYTIPECDRHTHRDGRTDT